MISIISSSENKLVKHIKKLSSKKNRKKFKEYIIESRKLLLEALASDVEIKTVILREDIVDSFPNEKVLRIDRELFNKLSSLESPDGYMAIVEFKREAAFLSKKIIFLDRIQDPGNLGTIIRSAEAFGFNSVLAFESVDPYNEKSLRASMGSIFRLDFREASYKDLVGLKKDYKIYTADMSGQDFKMLKYFEKSILVIGNEANGISDEIKEMTDIFIRINMEGKIESLNAAISASIIMNQM